jgi:hypothetical protein
MKRQLTAEQEAARDARRSKFRAMVKQIGNMSEPERLAILPKVGCILTADGGCISGMTNTMLLLMQCPGVSMVGGFRQWLKHGRAVCKGQHGLMIWVPIGNGKPDSIMADSPPAEGAGDGETRFIIGTVFDISQTQEIETGRFDALESAGVSVTELIAA